MTKEDMRSEALRRVNDALQQLPQPTDPDVADGAVDALLMLAVTCHLAARGESYESAGVVAKATTLYDVLRSRRPAALGHYHGLPEQSRN